MKKSGLVVMAAAIFACALPPEIWARGERGTPAERLAYAEREAAAQGLENFRAGCPGPDGPLLVILILTLPITLPIFGLYKLGEWTAQGVKSLFHGKPIPAPTAPRTDLPPVPTGPEKVKGPGTLHLSWVPQTSCLGPG
jgi:hypothetical protein